jgi:hypothetical protein
MALIKLKSSDAGNSDAPKRRYKVPSFKRKSESSSLNKERKKKSCSEVTKIYGKNESFICEIEKKGKEIHAGFAVAPQTAKVTGTV